MAINWGLIIIGVFVWKIPLARNSFFTCIIVLRTIQKSCYHSKGIFQAKWPLFQWKFMTLKKRTIKPIVSSPPKMWKILKNLESWVPKWPKNTLFGQFGTYKYSKTYTDRCQNPNEVEVKSKSKFKVSEREKYIWYRLFIDTWQQVGFQDYFKMRLLSKYCKIKI